MSLDSTMPSAGRPLQEQAHALVAFLAARDNVLTTPQAASALDGLPDDPKPAAKELRGRLKALGVDLQHTHALKAVAEARGAPGILGLAQRDQWVLCSWSLDLPNVSARRATFSSAAAAADELCHRIRREYENAQPTMDLESSEQAFAFVAFSRETGNLWKSALVRLTASGEPAAFPLADARHLTERIRRLVEGELRGWVTGISAIEHSYAVPNPREDVPYYVRHDDELLSAVMANKGLSSPSELLEFEVPHGVEFFHSVTLSEKEWAALVKRGLRFYATHGLLPDAWITEQLDEPDEFEGVPINLQMLQDRCITKGMTVDELLEKLQFPGDQRENLSRGQLALRHLPQVAQLLQLVSPADLMERPTSATRIPLPKVEDLALWLSRAEHVEVVRTGTTPERSFMENNLTIVCAEAFSERKRWSSRAPANLEAVVSDCAARDLVVCASMQLRFLRDVPTKEWRPATTTVLDLVPNWEVLTQNGQLEPSDTEVVTPEWLRRFNAPKFTGDEMLKYSDRTQELRVPGEDAGPNDNFIAQARAGVEVFKKDAQRAHAATVRMEALARLIEQHPLEPWVRKSSSSGALMVQEAAFDATAKCALVDVAGRPGFDHRVFYLHCATYERT